MDSKTKKGLLLLLEMHLVHVVVGARSHCSFIVLDCGEVRARPHMTPPLLCPGVRVFVIFYKINGIDHR